MKNKNINLKDETLTKKIQSMIEKSKKLNLIKPLSSAFEATPCEKEEHKGKKESFNK